MDIKTTTKYLEFVATECQRHLEDGRVTDDELMQLIAAFEKFQKETMNSELPIEIKNWIKEIKFNYSPKKLNRGILFMAITFISLGSWAYIAEFKRQSSRKVTLKNLEDEVTGIAFKIKMQY